MLFTFYRRLRRSFGVFLGVVVPAQNCRFIPTCSQYCERAIQKYGLLLGTLKCVGRLLRCHPLHPGGFDPI